MAITLPRDEALVLFEWLGHELETGRLDQLLTDGADWVAVIAAGAAREHTGRALRPGLQEATKPSA